VRYKETLLRDNSFNLSSVNDPNMKFRAKVIVAGVIALVFIITTGEKSSQ
jgi:hypothetical protein